MTKESHISLHTQNGQLIHDPDRDILKISAIEGTQNQMRHFNGFIAGFGLKEGAFASTGAWDSANIIVIGTDARLMALAVNRVQELGGGIVVCGGNGKKLAELALPHYGLFADEPMDRIIAQAGPDYRDGTKAWLPISQSTAQPEGPHRICHSLSENL